MLIAPGVDVRLTPKVRLYADVALPLYQPVNSAPSVAIKGASGQLVASAVFKMQLAYDF